MTIIKDFGGGGETLEVFGQQGLFFQWPLFPLYPQGGMDAKQKPKQIIEASFGRRVYEYQGSNGVTYYSFTEQADTVSAPVRLRLVSRRGTHLINFLVKMRHLGTSGFEG